MTEPNYTPHPDYNKLPESLKAIVSEKQYAWMTDDQRKDLVQRECEPEDIEDDLD